MWNSRTNLSFHISTPMSVAEGMKDVLGSVIGPLVYEEFFLFFLSCERHGKKRKGSRVRAQDPRTPENKSESESESERDTHNVADTLASFSGVAPRHRIGESESRMLGWAQRARRGRNNATRYHVFFLF